MFGALGLPLLGLWLLTVKAQPAEQGPATSMQPSADGSATVIRCADATQHPLAATVLVDLLRAWCC